MPRTTVLLADDHAIVAQGLASLLSETFDLVGNVGDGRALLEAAKERKPDVIVTDISMPLLNGLDAVRQLKQEGIRSKVIVLTQHKETHYAVEAFRAGVSGYLLKMSAGDELKSAIDEVMQGRAYLTPLIAKDLISVLMEARTASVETGPKLTSRQREILQLIAEGKTAKEIGTMLEISTRTAEGHKYEIMSALGVKTTAELVQQAIRLKLVDI
jgi:DNA-binding NarL/FixJ family response regulator